jgi:hypothetical protein
MKRLFQVNTSPVSYFDNKVDAKKARGDLVPAKDDKPAHYTLRVSKGPDHIGNHGHTVTDAARRGPRDANGNRNTPPDLAKRAAKSRK